MKQLLLILALFGCKIAAADIVVHRNMDGNYYYCPITPYLCDACGGDTAKQLSVTIVSDNVIDEAEFYWVIYSSQGSNRWNGNVSITGAAYRNYRDVDCSVDSFAKAKWLYNYVHTLKPSITPVE